MQRTTRLGFTLVELLVVLGIIAILLAILLPSVSGSRQRAVATKCASNVRQSVQTLHLYANDNNGKFPPYFNINDPSGLSWCDYLRPYTVNLKANDTSNKGRRWDPTSIFNCPAVKVDKNFKVNPLAPYGVDYASTIGYTFAVTASRWRYARSKVPAASEVIMVGDMNVTDDDRMSTADGYRIETAANVDSWQLSGNGGQVAARHEDKANMAFVDAHVEPMSTNDLTRAGTKWIWYTVN
jgi:prepilin-type N-terminal cleavage/methylation domain-containing protein/prepilin-type processing-associated H-X9-DG protein